ncbi:MAG: NAD(P)H:quinone oxidoreductase [Pseudomonadota bacterium]|nr:NAD(P)H:quinone oxidoreductase [Pseudomonadota bacterium]
MAKVLILYYSMHGHVERMAQAVAAGVTEAGSQADLKRVPEIVDDETLRKLNAVRDESIPDARIEELPNYDAIVFGAPTRYGNVCAQMRTFIDQTGSLWQSGALIGKVGSAFTASATQHGGQESTLLTLFPTLMHLGMVIVGLPYSCTEQMGVDEIKGGSPYGASTIAGSDGKRMPSEQELAMANFQGRHVAQIAQKLTTASAAVN